ncbi:MAG: CYTH domain-containing protein [Desulfobacteraceae bacterium]|nr:CYTH domain-containing protein [Desulfobacteraceae bacterium]
MEVKGGRELIIAMPVEIERKFLVSGTQWRQAQGIPYSQGYLNRDKERTVRVRIAGAKAYLTIKGISRGAARTEFEYEVPPAEAAQMLELCDGPILRKTRYTLQYKGFTWEVDEFLEENKGLVIAEVELRAEDQPFERPVWVGREVTGDPRYYNANLVVHPYREWRGKDGSV